MNMIQPFVLVLLIFFLQPLAHAEMTSAPEDAVQTVEQSLSDLIDLLGNTTLSTDKSVAQDEILALLEENLAKVIAFKSIVKRVMGKHFAGASKEQRNRFLAIFKKNLVTSYGRFLINTDLKSLAKKVQYQVLSTPKTGQGDRAQVTVVFKVGGKSYEAVYAMKYNVKKKSWHLENLVVEGVNLGINFRNQFDRMMTRNQNDYDRVIDEWAGFDTAGQDEG